MKTRALLSMGSALLVSSSLIGSARADTVCKTIDEFNALMSGSAESLAKVTLKFDVTGVNPADFAGSKGCLVDFHDTLCAAGAGATLKVYGPDDPPNTAHPAGTLKFEFGNQCCPVAPCQTESWAEPNASAQVFADGTEHCTVNAWLDPDQIGYKIECGTAAFEGAGDNVDDLKVNRIAMLQRIDGGWAIPNGVSMSNEVCFEQAPPDPNRPVSMDVPVLEDVTVSVATPSSVYPAPEDLSVGANDSEIYLKFDLAGVPGKVQKAVIFLHQSDDGSANGDGGDAFVVPGVGWSESTLTWSNRPAAEGASLARQGPVSAYDWYRWDVSAAVSTPGVYGFAIRPETSDANAAHFFSKEASSSPPYLHVEYVPGDVGGSGGGAASSGTSGATSGSSGGADGDEPAGSTGAEADPVDLDNHGCGGCQVPQKRGGNPALLLLTLGLALGAARRIPRRKPRSP